MSDAREAPPPLRVLVAKPGLDGHDRGAKVVAIALARAGCEVIYTGLHRTVDEIARAAADEGVDAVGISILSGAHLLLAERLVGRLREAGLAEIPLVVGGNIPPRDRPRLTALGVAAVFPTGSDLDEIASFFKGLPRRSGSPLPAGEGRGSYPPLPPGEGRGSYPPLPPGEGGGERPRAAG